MPKPELIDRVNPHEARAVPIVDSSMTLEQALSLPQESDPPVEILARQRIVDVQYYSFDGRLHQGQLVVDDELVEDVRGAFDLIRDSRFPIESAVPTGVISKLPEADRPMAWRNSIGFNYRQAVGKRALSYHSIGRTLDINPQQNPYIKGDLVVPPSAAYDPSQPGTIIADSELVAYFKSKGWEWGGDFEGRKDYMHFQKPVPQAIFVLGGGNRVIEKKGKPTRYTTSPYKGRFFPEKTGGAKARPIAALQLAEQYPGAKIVTMSQRPEHLAEGQVKTPEFAVVLKGDLIRYGIKEDRIIEQPASTSSLTEIMEVVKLAVENDWSNVDVIASDYQVERAQILLDILLDPEQYDGLKNQLRGLITNDSEIDIFEQKMAVLEAALEKFKAAKSRISFVSAEDVLIRRSKHHANLVNHVRSLEGYANIQKQERETNQKIRAGGYKFDQRTFRQYIMSLH